MKLLYGKKNRIIVTALVLLVTVFVSAVISFSSETELDYVKSQVELLYDELLVQDDRLINSDTYFVTSEYISRIKPNTSIEEFTNTLNRSDFTLLEGGTEVTNGIVKTGMELVRGDEHYTLVVAGDLNKDGLMNYVDTSMMINNTKTLSDNQLIRLANDFNEDSKYDKTDVLNSVDYILDEKIELKEVNKVKTPVIDFVSGNVGDREWYLDDIKLKLTATENTEIGYKIIGSVDEMGVVEDGYEITLSGYGAYKVIAWHIGEDGNRSDTTSLVYKIDDREIIPTITYSSTEIGSERVIAAISFNKENVFITNNDGRYTHTFYGNGDFQFQYKDLTGRVGRAQAMVSWVTDSVGEDGLWRYSVLNDEEIYLREYLEYYDGNYDVVIPNEYDGYKVYGVGNNIDGEGVFTKKYSSILSIHISEGIKEIGDYAFAYLDIVSSFSIPSSVETIGNSSFSDCLLGGISFSEGLKMIGSNAFKGAYINADIDLPDSLVEIGDYAFKLNSGAGMKLGANIRKIGDCAFCAVGFSGDLSLPDTLEEIGENAFSYNNFSGNLVIPNKIAEIKANTFQQAGTFESLVLNDNLTIIGDSAFSNNRFSGNLVIPESVVSIGNSAFYSNSFVGDLIIPDSVETIDELAFSNSGFTGKLTLGRGLTSIENHVFDSCSFNGDLIIPDNIKQIGQGAFNSNNFTGSLTLNDNIDYIGPIAFATNNFTGDLVIPPKVTSVGVAAFNGSGFDGKLVLNDSLKTIYTAAFNNNSFVGDLVIPNSVETIGNNAFEYAGFTGDLIIGNGVKTIEYGAFGYTDFTGDLVIGNSLTNLDWVSDSGIDLSKFTGSLSIGNGITEIPSFFFENSGFTGDLVIGDSVTDIGTDAFTGTSFAGSLVIGDGITDLNVLKNSGLNINAFTGNLEIGDGVTEIPDSFFRGVGFTGTLSLGQNVKSINFLAFFENQFTGKLIIPDSVETIGTFAFAQNKFSGDLILGKNVRTIDEGAFYQIVDLTGTVDASKIESLHDFAFEGTQVNIINK